MKHTITVAWTPNNHGYPYRATCGCGWQSNTYAAEHAAQTMGDDHAAKANFEAGIKLVHTNTRKEDIALSKQLFG